MEKRFGFGYCLDYFENGLGRQNIRGYFVPTETNILFSGWETNVMHELLSTCHLYRNLICTLDVTL